MANTLYVVDVHWFRPGSGEPSSLFLTKECVGQSEVADYLSEIALQGDRIGARVTWTETTLWLVSPEVVFKATLHIP